MVMLAIVPAFYHQAVTGRSCGENEGEKTGVFRCGNATIGLPQYSCCLPNLYLLFTWARLHRIHRLLWRHATQDKIV